MALWTPEYIETALWLDAADNSTTVLDQAGNISQWEDKSGNGWDASQPNSALRPALTIMGLGGRDVLTFSADMLRSANGALNLSRISLFIVASSVTSGSLLFGIPHHPTSHFDPFFRFAWWHLTTTTMKFRLDGADYSVNNVENFFSPTPGILFQDTLDGDVWRNGMLLEEAIGRAITYPNSAPYTIGGNAADGELMTGTVAEIIAISGGISSTDRQIIEGYLAHKWGLPANLPADHPYKSAAPTVTSISGIIRDRFGNPCQRKVYAVSRPTDATVPQILAHGLSDPVTGAYELILPTEEETTVIALGDEGENALIYDRVIPQ